MDKDPKPSGPEPRTLAQRIAAGTIWSIAGRLLIRGAGLINTLIVARIVLPEDYALVAVAVTLMQLLQNLSDIGISQTVVKFRQSDRNFIDTLFTLSVIRGALVAAVLLALTPLSGLLFDDPRAGLVIAAISIAPFLLGLKNPKFYEFERDLTFSRLFQLEAIAKVSSVIVTVSIALTFRTYWAIIIGICAGALTETLVSYLLQPHRPRFTLSAIRQLIGFTGWVAGVSFVVALNNKLDTLLMPKLAGPAATSAFYMGHMIADLPTEDIAAPMAKAVYPGLSELQEREQQMNRTFLQGVEVLGAIALPATIGCAFVASDLISVLLGPNWSAAILVLQIYGPAAAFVMLFMSLQGYAMAKGLTKYILYRELGYFAFRTPLLIWAALAFGLIGAIWATATAAFVRGLASLLVYSRVSNRPFWEPVWQVRRSLLACAAMGLWFFGVKPFLPLWEDMLPLLRLTFDSFAGATIYLATHYLLWIKSDRPAGAESMLLEQLKDRLPQSGRNLRKPR